MTRKCCLEIRFANSVFHRRDILLIFLAEFTESVDKGDTLNVT